MKRMEAYDPLGRRVAEDADPIGNALHAVRGCERAVARRLAAVHARFEESKAVSEGDSMVLWRGQEVDLASMEDSLNDLLGHIRMILEMKGVEGVERYLPPLKETKEAVDYHMRRN